MPTPKKLVLLDAHAIIHRAYHALPPLANSRGEATGALYGLSSMLLKAIGDLKPDYLIACYDRPEETFRKQAYADYKAHRPKTDETLVAQLIRSHEIFEAFSTPIYDAPGFEADDIIGTIVEETRNEKELQVVIVSGDLDTLQLVSGERVVVYTSRKGFSDTVIYDEEGVRKRFALPPRLLADFKGLRGDPSDNIIGIAGIGEKTATELVARFGSIEEIYQHLEKNRADFLAAGFKERVIKLLEGGKEEALFSKTLATIRRDAPIEFVLPRQLFSETFNTKKAEALFKELEFTSLIRRLVSKND